MKIIDPHLHLFNLEEGDYQWLKADNPPFWPDKKVIEKNFQQQDLQLSPPIELSGFVHIEAGFDNQQPWREIAWLESTCSQPFRSIAAIDLLLPCDNFLQVIEQLCRYQSVVGVRDILDENALAYLSNTQVQMNLEQLAKHQLIFECQMSLVDVPATKQLIKVIKALPTLSIVINHAGFPPEQVNGEAWKDWQQSLQWLSNTENVAIKCSGFEMINRQYPANWQQQIIQQCITILGLNKIMLASNFPLCLFKESYQKNWQNYQESNYFSKKELEYISYKNAQRIYQFSV
jgi:predicted TIM-barrel fold metal-dependent hydrolase